MNENDNPASVLSHTDHGDDMQRRVRYQATYAATIALGMLLEPTEIVEVYCEHHEDLLIRKNDGTFCGCQVKTRQAKLGPFKADDAQIKAALGRFMALEIQFFGKFGRFVIATNVAFWQQEESSKNLPFLIGVARLIKNGTKLKLSNEIRKFIRSFSEEHKCKRDRVWSVLARTELDPELPQFQDVEMQLAIKIAEVLDESQRRLDELARAARALIQMVMDASSLNHKTPLIGYFVFLQNPTASEEAAIIEGKRISKAQLVQTIRQSFHSETLLASCSRISVAELPKGVTLLEKKMGAGGVSVSEIALLKDFKFSTDKLLQEWMWKYGPEEAIRRYDHMQLAVKEDCFEASAKTSSKTTYYGTAMLARVRENLRATNRVPSLKFSNMGITYHHLLGISGILTEDCAVWWSERFNPNEEV
jgi:hypothetical protein